ncbi:MAG: choice-of-anchor J domain-containing protein [Bacteroidales bacterium]|nr:choice-of-anchor J domain-containing protein [Bacteroidales bacterium]
MKTRVLSFASLVLAMGLLFQGHAMAQTTNRNAVRQGAVLQSAPNTAQNTTQRQIISSGTKAVVASGDTISYCGNNAFSSSIGVNDNTTNIYWGIHFPASALTGRNSISDVQIYIPTGYGGNYTVDIYQGGTTAPQTLVTSQSQTLTATNNWVSALSAPVAINNTMDLWIIFENADVTYPASGCTYVGDSESDYISLDGSTFDHSSSDYNLNYSWMIRCITSANTASPVIVVNGPTTVVAGMPTTFTASTNSSDNIVWTLNGGTPATATGASATATWNAIGTYDVIATAGTIADTLSINVISCDAAITEYPYTMGFEADEQTDCFVFLDADDDGNGWVIRTMDNSYVHSGTSAAGSASWNSTPLTPDNWMILPKMHLQTGGTYTLTFWQGIIDPDYYAEQYSVLVSTSGVSTSDFTMLQQYTINDTNWLQKTIDLSAYAGQDIRIAFRHYGSTDEYWMLIDDIMVTEAIAGQANITYECAGSGEGTIFDDQYGYTTSLCGSTKPYDPGTSVTLQMSADDCSMLSQLIVGGVDHTQDLTTTDNGETYEYTFTAQDNATVRVVFAAIQYTVTATATSLDGQGTGTVTGDGTYNCGSTATLTANAGAGSCFVRWSDGNTDNPRTLTVTNNITLQALFEMIVGIDAVENTTAVMLQPNPAVNYVDVVLSGLNGEALVQVIDLNGRIALERSVTVNGESTLRIDTQAAGLARGSYLVRVVCAGQSTVAKLVVK